jgi:hypothetical protein
MNDAMKYKVTFKRYLNVYVFYSVDEYLMFRNDLYVIHGGAADL